MHPVTTSTRHIHRCVHLAALRPERRQVAVCTHVLPALRELCADVALVRVGIMPQSSARGRRLGYLVEVVCDLPLRRSDLDPNDLDALATLVESQLGIALLPLCRSLCIAHIALARDASGDVSCSALVWVPAAPSRQTSSRGASRCRPR